MGHGHHHGHDAHELSVHRQTFPSKAEVLAQTPDPAVRQMLQRLEEAGCETCFDRQFELIHDEAQEYAI